MKKIRLPFYVKKVLKTLEQSNYEAFVVGGCVRDSILNRPIKDYDICTNALPEDIIDIFENKKYTTLPTGLKHGTVTVVINKHNVEITTYRVDGEYKDGRHPEEVKFSSSLEEDLKRRDFTINALAYNPKTGIIDKNNGLGDIEKKEIRCVGNPKDRFQEDYLRILRAIRFANKLDFDIEKETAVQIVENSKGLSNISVERKREEFNQIISCGRRIRCLEALKYCLPEIFVENEEMEYKTNKTHTIFDLIQSKDVTKNLTLLILYGIIDIKILDLYIYDNKTKKIIIQTLKAYEKFVSKIFVEDKGLRYLMKREVLFPYTEDIIENILFVLNTEFFIGIDTFDLVKNIKRNHEPYLISHLAIDGNDLQNLGYKNEEIGKALIKALELVMEHPEKNKKKILLDYMNTH